jgi:hypothetical protein
MNYLINALRLEEFSFNYLKFLYIFLFTVFSHNGFGQSTSGIGIGGGVNLPIHQELKSGIELFLKSDIRLSNRLALVPMAGFMQLKKEKFQTLIM